MEELYASGQRISIQVFDELIEDAGIKNPFDQEV